MSSFTDAERIVLTSGDLLASKAQTLVNTVNCVGIMGKGIALAFKRRYPEMFEDYVRRCDRGEVELGRPYVYRAADHLIVNFPTKRHWRAVSRLDDIIIGLEYLEAHYEEWGVTSLAVPPLGCGNGQLEWDVVGPTLHRHLSRLRVPVELYVPFGVPVAAPGPEQLALAIADEAEADDRTRFVEPEWVALIAVLDRLQRHPHHWPVGRIMFQKLAYFATWSGVPTGLEYQAGSYGPYSDSLKRMVARLQNNGLVVEQQRGNMFEVVVGPTYRDAVDRFRDQLEVWRPAVERTVDLMARMDTHYAALDLCEHLDRKPSATEVVDAVQEWKVRRNPPLTRESIAGALAVLALRGWIEVEIDDAFRPLLEDAVGGI
jgi:uncharacterized protein YwgA/O-acetyl-ADP-ribose deacetylase (regulator of RNase III)